VTQITSTTNVTLLLLAKGNLALHHGDMNEYKDMELGTRILPGVDLALWLRIIGFVILAALAVGITFAVR
jgi:hypothetical protein